MVQKSYRLYKTPKTAPKPHRWYWPRDGTETIQMVKKKKMLQNCTPLLQQLHWLPISERIKYKTACMCYNAITSSALSYLSELLHLYSPSRSLRSSSDARMLKFQRFNRKTHGFRTFSHFGPHIWNNLPQDIRHSATHSSFKSQFRTFLFSEYFS